MTSTDKRCRVKMIAIDMDGTLLNRHRQVSAENARAVKEAQASGITVVVATGRSYKEALPPLRNAGITCPLICVNGAEVRSETGEIVRSVPIHPKTYEEAEAVLRQEDLYYELYTNRGTFTNDREKAFGVLRDFIQSSFPGTDEQLIRETDERRFSTGEISSVDTYAAVLGRSGEHLYKLLVFSRDEQKLARVSRRLAAVNELSVSSSANHNLEVTHRQAQKGIALQEFADRLGVALEETMAIGDNFNDLSMLRMVGLSVAMGNAEDEIKRACAVVTGNNDQHGVARAIREWALSQREKQEEP
jgi:Cof subfamily protein (haloacid dehalogenase superfamily)